ncbi:MAG: PqqD family protein [Lachnospiraceae bacterium]|nr:PqqD family protein [Lachnospiraceae bacterium]
MRKKEKENYLDYIPKRNILFPYKENKKKLIEIERKNKGLFNRIAQIFFRRPKVSYIELDAFGSFVWMQIDGQRSVYEIGKAVKEKFGQDAEPLYERLAKFLHILRSNDFIVYTNLQNKKK